MNIYPTLILLFIAGITPAQPLHPEFELVKEDSPVFIYERWVTFPGKSHIEAREVKGVFPVRSSIPIILELLRDETRIKLWQSHIERCYIYPLSDSTWLEYSLHDIPWPMSDQEHFIRYTLKEVVPGKEVEILFESAMDEKLAPANPDATRLELAGSWHLLMVDDNFMKITYRIFSTPSNIPRMITDPIVRSNLMSTIKSLTKLAEGSR